MNRERNSPDLSPPARMYNSGAGTREVFRTPSLGTAVIFDLRETLLFGSCWIGDAAKTAALGNLTPQHVARISRELLEQLGISTAPRLGNGSADARALLQAITRHLVASGRARTCVGLASAHERTEQSSYMTTGNERQGANAVQRFPPSSALDAALTLGVYAVFAPPLILWTRTPSLRWFRNDTLIVLRRFGKSAREAV